MGSAIANTMSLAIFLITRASTTRSFSLHLKRTARRRCAWVDSVRLFFINCIVLVYTSYTYVALFASRVSSLNCALW